MLLLIRAHFPNQASARKTTNKRARGEWQRNSRMTIARLKSAQDDAAVRESAFTLPVYRRLQLAVNRASGCDIVSTDGRHILDLYGGDSVAVLGYGHPRIVDAIKHQSQRLLYQDSIVALDVRATAAEKLLSIAPGSLARVQFVNCGEEAVENALRIAFMATGRRKILAVTQGFHGRSAASGAVSWNAAGSWYGFPQTPFDVEFIPRNDVAAAHAMIDNDVAAVIFEPIQSAAGAFDLSLEFVEALRAATRSCAALLIADEVQSCMGRSGQYFAIQTTGVEPDIMTCAKALGGGIPCGAVLVSENLASLMSPGDIVSTGGGGPVAAAAIVAVIDSIQKDQLLQNVREREQQIREQCVRGPVTRIQGMGLMLGLVCDRPAREVQSALLEHDILTGVCDDPFVLTLLPPLVLQAWQVDQLADTLGHLAPET